MELKFSSPVLYEGNYIPVEYTGYGIDISPEFNIEGISEDAVSMIITLDDANHPRIKNFNHWIAYNIPPVSNIPSRLPKGAVVEEPIHMQQGRAYGNHKYRGPKTPYGETHVYVYNLYVLDCTLDAGWWSNKKKIMKLAEGHIIQSAKISCLFTPGEKKK